MQTLTIRHRAIRTDDAGRISLSDIYASGIYGAHQTPNDWWRVHATQKLAAALIEKSPGITRPSAKMTLDDVYKGKFGPGGGVYAHPILACAYAGYLSPELEIEVRELWLRYRSGDPTLADEVLERASPAANLWVATRAEARAIRNDYTATLKDHGVAGRGYMECTNEAYIKLFDGSATKMRRERGLKKRANVRDKMNLVELSAIKLTEALATERIEEEDRQGNYECKEATGRTAANVRTAIDLERRDRQKRIV